MEYIVNTTTTDYTLIVAEDLSINGGLVTEGDVSMNKGLYVKDGIQAATITDGTAIMSQGALLGVTDISASGLTKLTNVIVNSDISLNENVYMGGNVNLSTHMGINTSNVTGSAGTLYELDEQLSFTVPYNAAEIVFYDYTKSGSVLNFIISESNSATDEIFNITANNNGVFTFENSEGNSLAIPTLYRGNKYTFTNKALASVFNVGSAYQENTAVVVTSTGDGTSVSYDVKIEHALDVNGNIRTKKYMFVERDATIDGRLFVAGSITADSINIGGLDISDRLDILDTSSNAHNVRLDTLDTTTSDHADHLTVLDTSSNAHKARLDTLDTTTSDHADRLTVLDTSSNAHKVRLDTLDTTTSDHTDHLTVLDTSSNAHKVRLDTLDTTTSDHADRLTVLDTSSNAHKVRLDTLDTTTSDHADHLTVLDTSSNAHKVRLDTLDTTTSDHADHLTVLDTSSNAHKVRLDTLDTTTSDHTDRLTVLDTSSNAHKVRLDTLDTTTSDHADRLTVLDTSSNAHKGPFGYIGYYNPVTTLIV